jgi:aminotransferase in exopolysaccharide biosynthesis
MFLYEQIVQFIRALYNQPEGIIPLHAPVFIGNEKKYVTDCIDTTFVSSVGKYVDRFEAMIEKYTGAKKAIATVNGTNALHLALLSVGVKPGDEVITQPLTFIATANAISYTGAKPVFIDVDKDTMGLSPQAMKQWLNNSTIQRFNDSTNKQETLNKKTGKRIASCVPMHTFGHPCRIDEIIEICNEYNIPVVEDAAESLGSFYSPRLSRSEERGNRDEIRGANILQGKEQHTGTFGKFGILSFNGNKTITTGGGGMIITNDEELGNHIKHLTTQAKVPHSWEYVHDQIGYNYRMPNINAALGVAQMERIEEIIENKRQTAHKYSEFFSTIQRFNDSTIQQFFTEPPNTHANYWLNAILLNNKQERDNFLNFANENGIMTRPIWRLMNKLEMFKDCQTGDLSNAEWLEDRVVNLPSSVLDTNERK